MALTLPERPKTPARTYVVSGALLGVLCLSLGFGIFLMFNPDRSEYQAALEGHPGVEHDQVLISGCRKVVPMHNAPRGHSPTFGSPREGGSHVAIPAPISNSVPPPLIQHMPPAPSPFVQNTHQMGFGSGAAGAAVPYHPTHVNGHSVNAMLPAAAPAINTSHYGYNQHVPQYAAHNVVVPYGTLGGAAMTINGNRLKTMTTR